VGHGGPCQCAFTQACAAATCWRGLGVSPPPCGPARRCAAQRSPSRGRPAARPPTHRALLLQCLCVSAGGGLQVAPPRLVLLLLRHQPLLGHPRRHAGRVLLLKPLLWRGQAGGGGGDARQVSQAGVPRAATPAGQHHLRRSNSDKTPAAAGMVRPAPLPHTPPSPHLPPPPPHTATHARRGTCSVLAMTCTSLPGLL
jgi:hypothetical protein